MKPGKNIVASAKRELFRLAASFFYLGYIPVAPGTMGAGGGMLLYILLHLSHPDLLLPPLKPGHVLFLALFFLVGVAASFRGEEIWKMKDPPFVVIDEAFSYFLTMFLLPYSAVNLLAGLVLNRLFDVVKPPPVDFAEHLPGGWGVMLDDVVAGCYSHLCLRLILLLIPR